MFLYSPMCGIESIVIHRNRSKQCLLLVTPAVSLYVNIPIVGSRPHHRDVNGNISEVLLSILTTPTQMHTMKVTYHLAQWITICLPEYYLEPGLIPVI